MSNKSNGKRLNLENGVIFQGFDSLYKQVINIKDQLLCTKVQAEVEETSMTLRICLNHFRARSERSASKPNEKNFKTYAK
jgi:hypothetical protein